MPSIYALKPKFQNRLRPLCRQLAHWGIRANQVTIVAIILSLLMGLLFAWQWHHPSVLLLLPLILLLRMGLNALDGMLAREHGMQTPLGALLNELGDVIADSGLYLPFALLPTVTPLLVILIVLLSVLTEMTGVIAIQIGAQRRYDGPMGKSDRAVFFGTMALLLGLGVPPGVWLNMIFILMLILLILTIINRGYQALKQVESHV